MLDDCERNAHVGRHVSKKLLKRLKSSRRSTDRNDHEFMRFGLIHLPALLVWSRSAADAFEMAGALFPSVVHLNLTPAFGRP
jgi:hypothetical protein